MAEKFDLVIIGSGNAGYIPAIRAGQLGMSVALVEREENLGGTCLNWGCIPTKALLHTAEKLDDIRHGEDLGISASFEFDYSKTAERRDGIVNQLRQGVSGLMKKNKVKVHTGTASFLEPKKIQVKADNGETSELEAENVLIAVGSSVSSLPGLEFDGGERVISSDDVVTGQDAPPESIIILGSGAVGTEFASMYNDFGTEVTLVEVLDRIVPLEDPEISEQLQKSFKGRGINVMTQTKADPQSLEKTDGGVRLKIESAASGEQSESSGEGGSYGGEDAPVGEADGGQSLEAEKILVAVGRKTNVEGLGLENTKVQTTDRGIVQVDGHYQTDEPGVYAAGDVVGGYWLAHAAGHEGITAVEHMAGEDPMELDQDLVPRVTFCRPEVASFGLSKDQAEEQGYEVKESKFPFRAIGKALIEGEPNGFFKIVADADTDLILGMHAIGPSVTDLISEGVFAKLVEGTPQEIGMAIHPHPALSEVVGESAMAVDGHAIHY
ncbi:dihydrolipoyl dehydrogenase [Rubrobacter aplysinae]|uniref:dihydrolipoyl dehydrogenase n=1 Tax=Rubrobacter aplysinae TaxID=909625 RepID=UPI00064C44C0|nr:dihydrolipoyl dehydrogenase [Rubrobacter aplysinae]